jgi:hypothetical protein
MVGATSRLTQLNRRRPMKHVRNLLAALLLAPPPEPATSLTDSSKTIVTTDADGKIIVATEEPIDYLVDALMAMLSVF